MNTHLIALCLLATALVVPTAAASPATCNGSHALIAYVDCAVGAANEAGQDAQQCAQEQIYIWSDPSGFYVRWDCPFFS